MPIADSVVDDVVARALQLKLCFRKPGGKARHAPFTFTPGVVDSSTLAQLLKLSPMLGRLTQALAASDDLIQSVHAPLTQGDAFFAELLSMHKELHCGADDLPRIPLLLQRSDFMVDQNLGPKLVECNSIAAGMAPFGDRVQQLHGYIQQRWTDEYAQFSSPARGALLVNPALANMVEAMADAAQQVARDLGDLGDPGFLMVVQEGEDNVFDQQLLAQELQKLGVRTYRRTFRELHQQLSTGTNQRLQLAGCGTVHVVYLRAGYQYSDYVATDLDARRCCDALRATRIFIERHRVAVNATVAQQLATSKRMQLYLASGGDTALNALGFNARERSLIKPAFAQMRVVNNGSAEQLVEEGGTSNWVLKNQGEGGGHCLFDEDILSRLNLLEGEDYSAWVLMQRLRPAGRTRPTLIIRDGRASVVRGMLSEIGVFSAHLGSRPLATDANTTGHIGYLVRSRPPEITEAGVHSGFGALDSLFVTSAPGLDNLDIA